MEENRIKIIPAKDGWDVVYFSEGNEKCPDELMYEPVIGWAIDTQLYDPDTNNTIGVDPITVENMMAWEMLRRPDGSFIVPHVEDITGGETKALVYFQDMKKPKNNNS